MKLKNQMLEKGFSSLIDEAPYAWSVENGEVTLADDDSLPTSITVANVGVPAELLTNFNNKVIEILQSKTSTTEFAGERVLIGDWTLLADKYREEEAIGHVAPYSDFSAAGISDMNNVWVRRAFYLFQTVIRYGELETEINARAKINRIAQKQGSAANTINRFLNRAELYGIAGYDIYGLFNSPYIGAALTPDADISLNTDLYQMNALDMYDNLNRLFLEIIGNSGGTVDSNSKFRMASSPKMISAIKSKRSNALNLPAEAVFDMLKKSYPSLELVMMPECESAAGTEIYLRVEQVNGMDTCENITNCMLRVGKVVQELSSQAQKYTAGTGGMNVYFGFAIAHMLNSESAS